MYKTSKPRCYFFKTIESLLVSICFAIIIGCSLVVAEEVPGIGRIFRAVERLGIDTGMNLHTWFAQERRADRLRQGGAREPAYVFLDIGQRACVEFFRVESQSQPGSKIPSFADERCIRFQSAQPELVAAVLETVVAKSGPRPRVVLIDALLIDRESAPDWPPRDKEGKSLKKIGYDARVPIIAVIPTRWSGYGTGLWVDRLTDPIEVGLLNRETSLSATAFAFAYPSEEGDSLVRRYWPAQLSLGDSNSPDRLVPTIAFAAAAIAHRERDGLSQAQKIFHDPPSGCSDEHVLSLAADFRLDPQLLCTGGYRSTTDGRRPVDGPILIYSIPSLAIDAVLAPMLAERPDRQPAPRNRASGLQDRASTSYNLPPDDAIYRRIPIVVGPDKKIQGFSKDWLQDAIVVIGSSSPSGNDWHLTPIGSMAGAELIINATRAFLTFPTPATVGLPEKLLRKVEISVIAAVCFSIVAWLPIWALVRQREQMSNLIARAVLSLTIVAVFLSGIGLTALLIVVIEMLGLERVVSRGQIPTDVVTPVFAVAIEGFAEGAKWILERLQGLAVLILSGALSWLLLTAVRLAKWWRGRRDGPDQLDPRSKGGIPPEAD